MLESPHVAGTEGQTTNSVGQQFFIKTSRIWSWTIMVFERIFDGCYVLFLHLRKKIMWLPACLPCGEDCT